MQAPGLGYERVVTPEAVPVDLDVAGLGSRGIAIFIDMLIQGVALFAIVLSLSVLHVSPAVGDVVLAVAAFLVTFGYFFIFEGLWHGRTPGKRTQHLRSVRADGHPMSTAQMFVRNIVRIVDFLPAYYAIGAVSIAVTKRSQRLGDLAGGTIVIREPKHAGPPAALSLPPPMPVDAHATPVVDATAMTEAHYQLVRSFLERRAALSTEARAALTAQVAAAIRPVVRTSAPIADERLLELAAVAYRSRFSAL